MHALLALILRARSRSRRPAVPALKPAECRARRPEDARRR